jgi:hypothetical protein
MTCRSLDINIRLMLANYQTSFCNIHRHKAASRDGLELAVFDPSILPEINSYDLTIKGSSNIICSPIP